MRSLGVTTGEDRRRAKLSRGKARALANHGAGAAAQVECVREFWASRGLGVLTAAGAYVDSMYTGLCGANARAKALGSAPCLVLRAIFWYAAGQSSRQPPRRSAAKMKFAMLAAQRYHGPAISQHRKTIP